MSVQAGPHVTTSSSTTTPTPSSLANECLAADGLVGRNLLPQKRAVPTFKGRRLVQRGGSAKLAFAWAVVMAHLRYVPLPYPAINSLARWKLQAQEMERHHLMPHGTFQKATTLGHFNMGAMQECMWLRNQMGLQVAFVEDPILMGMLAARSSKGLASQVKHEALKEAKAKAMQAEKDGVREEEARQLIGPRGGLPTLRGDLLRLAALLNVPIEANMTVAQIKEKVKPTVELLKSQPASKNHNKASSSSQDYAKPVPSSSPAVAKAPPVMTYSASPQVAKMHRRPSINEVTVELDEARRVGFLWKLPCNERSPTRH